MIDFQRLRSGPDGTRGAFEDLVRQLGKLNPPADAVEFRHIHGAGGDGGIEAYWILTDGGEYGYQAKFHTKSGDIDWAALDASIEMALKTHPKLVSVQVAIACDLTDKVAGRRGKSGWEHWDTHRSKWEAAAKAAGRTVTFEFWGASDIEQLLAAPSAAGLREYWFDEDVLSAAWLMDQFNRTAAMLDERFHPEDHVDVGVRTVFDGLRRTEKWRKRLIELHAATDESTHPPESAGAAVVAAFAALKTAIEDLRALEDDTKLPVERPIPIENWRRLIAEVRDRIVDAQAAMRNEDAMRGTVGDSHGYARYRLRKLREAIEALNDELDAAPARADGARFALMMGRAGSGKSHLLASEVEAAIKAGEPALMLLGTDFGGTEPPGYQIMRRLELSSSTNLEALLGMLSAAAERAGTRALLAIDAINEGGGARYWRDRLLAFVQTVLRHERMALCVSCRTEFAQYLLTSAVRKEAVEVDVPGFVTADEQEAAARVYMDRRGIVRPATPWLSPEFTNPLFLRTTCLSLEREGRHEFPRGMRGTRELLAFYLNTAGRHLGTGHDGSGDLLPALRRGVKAVAAFMAAQRTDHLPRSAAAEILDEAFASFAPPEGHGWLDLLRLRGLLRADPPPPDNDPLSDAEEVYRFGFQRFQDHLVAQALIAGNREPVGLFDTGGPLAFLLGKYSVDYDWQGVFQALAIQFADEWKVEIVDYLPGGVARWWDDYLIQDAFLESVRWRGVGSFTDRTLELLNEINEWDTVFGILLELGVVQGHPWNAELLHGHLTGLPLPERDSGWTQFINATDEDPSHPANRLVDWALGTGTAAATDETLKLALLGIGWLFTSTNGRLRDRGTKAATEILLGRLALHGSFLKAFEKIDDIYVVERVLAATAGACLRDPRPERVGSCAEAVFEAVFKESPLPHTLLRDYGRLVVELANGCGALPAAVDLARCRPPYDSAPPAFGLDKEAIEERFEAAGAYAIFSSLAGHIGDFGNYIVKNRTDEFTTLLLSGPPPLTHEEAYATFRRDLVDGDELASAQFDVLEQLYKLARMSARADAAMHDGSVSDLQNQILERLPEGARDRFKREALPYLKGKTGWSKYGKDLPRIDQEQARLWVAERALALGWTKALFPYDTSRGDERTRSERTERIGKKYQWIAYHELLARLADNYWIADQWDETSSKHYETPLDVEFTRDIDPTVPPSSQAHSPARDRFLPQVPGLPIRTIEPTDMAEWTFEPGVPLERLRLAQCGDVEPAGEWVTLYRYAAARLDYEQSNKRIGVNFRQDDFHYLMMVAVERRERTRFVSAARDAKLDFHDWLPYANTDGPYVYELGVRDTWPDQKWTTSWEARGPKLRYVRFTAGYHWEWHLDGSLPGGVTMQVPAPWLLRELDLRADPHRIGVYLDGGGDPVVVFQHGERNTYCIARRDRILPLLDAQGLVPLWAGIGERTGWPKQGINAGSRRRWNGLIWTIASGTRSAIWHDDHKG